MATPIRRLWEKVPKNIRNVVSTILKVVLTVLAFYLLLSHHVQMIDNRPVLLKDNTTLELSASDSFLMGSKKLTLQNGNKALDSTGKTFPLKEGMIVELPDGRAGRMLPLEKETTFSAIMGYLPKIQASTFWFFVFLAALIKVVGILSSMYRWHLLLQGQGIRFPFRHIIGSFLIGRFLGTFLPSTIGLDGYKLYDATRFSRRVIESTAATAIEKVLGVLGIFMTFLVALPFGISIFGAQAGKVAMLTVPIAFGIITIFFTLLFYPRLVQWFIEHIPIPGKHKVEGFINRVSKSAAAYKNKKLLLLNAAFQSFMVHFCTAAMYFFTALAIGALGATFWQVTFASSIQIFATVISPITIAGEGIREIAQYYFLRNQLGPAESIVSAALGFWAAEALTLFGAVFWWVRKRNYRPSFLYLDGKPADIEKLMKKDDIGMEDLKQSEDTRKKGWIKRAFFHRVFAGLSGGLLAGVLIGIIEATWILVVKGSTVDIFPYSILLYGLIGAAAGCGLGIALGAIAVTLGNVRGSLTTFSLALAGWFSANLLILGKFRLFRDVWKEQALPLSVKLILLIVCAITFFTIFYFTRSDKTDILSKIRKSVLTSIICLGIATVIWLGSMMFQNPLEKKSPAIPEHLESVPNVILIMCDALRADHLGCYGYPKAQTSEIDELAEQGVRFHSAYSQSSWTKPSTATIFSGMYPSGHNTYLKPDILPDSVTTIAEQFQKAGYYTIGFPNNINISPGFNFGQGFEEYTYLSPDYFFFASESSSELTYYSILRLIRERFLFSSKHPNHYYQKADIVHNHVIDYLDQRGSKEKFFMYLHYMEPHDPYFQHPFNGVGYARVEMPNPDPSMVGEFLSAYDQEITYLDHWLGKLFKDLKQRKLWDNTIILLTSDHGEEFYDHNGWWHGTTLYQEQISIPIIFKLPSGHLNGSIRLDNARHIDIAPTLLSLCGIPKNANMEFGRNLFNPANSQSKDWDVLAEENHEGNIISSYIKGSHKHIKTNKDNPRGLPEEELFRLDIDRYEDNNLMDQNPSILSQMQDDHQTAVTEAGQHAVKREKKKISAEELEKMKALGYVSE